MPVVAWNREIAPGIYIMRLTEMGEGFERPLPGQFYMLRAAAASFDPLLPRPLSVYDAGADFVEFCYRVLGRGTAQLGALRPGDTLAALGPLGAPFPTLGVKEAAAVGGGLGIAPLHYLLKTLKAAGAERRVFLGYSAAPPYLLEAFEDCAGVVHAQIGGFITDSFNTSGAETVYACGPEPMMRAAWEKAKLAGARCYVSLERRMACGLGACLGCSVDTRHGKRRVCKDGPVFPAEDIFGVQA